jgi:hypothetical protein
MKKKKPWFSPKELVKAVQIGPNSFRYQAKKFNVFDEEEEEEEKVFELKKRVSKSVQSYPPYGGKMYSNRNKKTKYWDDYQKPKIGYVIPERKVHHFVASSWSNYSFGFIVREDDDNSALYIKEPESYLTPTSNQIGLKVAAYNRQKIDLVKCLARVCYLKMIGDKDYVSDFHKKGGKYVGTITEEHLKQHITLYDNIYNTYVPGYSPLDQACAIYMEYEDFLANQRKKGYKENDVRSIFSPSFKRDDYTNPILNKLTDKSRYGKHRPIRILNKISIIGNMGLQFDVKKEVGLKVVPSSIHFKKQLMTSFSQVENIDVYQRVLPNFNLKFLSKDLFVNVPVVNSEKKQKLIIIVDYSGSMDYQSKQEWVTAILIDRLRYVITGDAEIFFSFFVSNPSDLYFTHLKNEQDVESFWKFFSTSPHGSMTNMGRIVEYISEQVSAGKLHNLQIDLSEEKPEILIINDGQDSVNVNAFPYKVNAISIETKSNQLKKLCVKSGGRQVFIDSVNNVESYSSEGRVKH